MLGLNNERNKRSKDIVMLNLFLRWFHKELCCKKMVLVYNPTTLSSNSYSGNTDDVFNSTGWSDGLRKLRLAAYLLFL
jgi:hypothetical protein